MTHDEPVITSAAAQPAAPPTDGGRLTLAPSLGGIPEPSVDLRRLLARDNQPGVTSGFQSSI